MERIEQEKQMKLRLELERIREEERAAAANTEELEAARRYGRNAAQDAAEGTAACERSEGEDADHGEPAQSRGAEGEG